MADQQQEITLRNAIYAKLVPQLRSANEHLVIAALEALDSQQLAEAANLRQTQFLSMLSHELRGPLHPIMIANELLATLTQHHPDLPLLHSLIARQVTQLARLVDDLMDAARASNGKILIECSPMPLQDAIDNAAEALQYTISARHQQLRLDVPQEAVFVHGDLVRLTQVFSNLLSNASKYTPEHGQIAISVLPGEDKVLIKVSDNGAGIPVEIQPFIFDLFTQGPRPERRVAAGLGVGLSLVRTITQLHGGSVAVYSPGSGSGSEFSVTLPRLAGTSSTPAAQPVDLPAAAARPRHILLVEDSADASEAIARLLELDGHTVTCRYDGRSGLAAAQSASFDTVICDVDLPDLTGTDIALTLRRQAHLPCPQLIALSGIVPDDLAQNDSANFDHYLTKPVSLSTLTSILQQDVVHGQPKPCDQQ